MVSLISRNRISVMVLISIISILVGSVASLILVTKVPLILLSVSPFDNLPGIRWWSELWVGRASISLSKAHTSLLLLLKILSLSLEILKLLWLLLKHLLWWNSCKVWNSWLERWRKIGSRVGKWRRPSKRIL